MNRLLLLHLTLTTAGAALLAGLVASNDSHAQATPAPRPIAAAASAGTAAAASQVPLPHLRGDYEAPRLVLAGTVPDDIERRALLARARAVYGAAHVVDQLVVAAVANPAWLSPAFLPDLRGATQATLRLEDGRLLVEGDAATADTHASLAAALDRLRGQGLAVDNRLRAPAR